MEKTQFIGGVGVMLLGPVVQQMGLLGPRFLWLITAIGLALCLYGCRHWLFDFDPKIVDQPVHDGLNLLITNNRGKADLFEDQLTLNSISRWEPSRKDFQRVDLFDKMPVAIYANQCHLPKGVTRTFALVNCTDKSQPVIEAAIPVTLQKVIRLLPGYGTWLLNLELRWAGGSTQVKRYIRWSEEHLPVFCAKPG
jgi:hypothetical protein